MLKRFLVLLILIAFAPVSSFAGTPKEFAQNLADKVVKTIEANKSEDQKEKALITLFAQNVDTDWMARFTMGKYFRQATPAQQQKYLGLYRDYVVYSYIPKFRMYAGERMTVNQVIDEGELCTVKTTLKTEKSRSGSVLVDYKLKKSGDTFKIVDVIGEGVSLIATQRSDFATPLADMGLDAFLTKLEGKVKALKANPPKSTEKIEKLSKVKTDKALKEAAAN